MVAAVNPEMSELSKLSETEWSLLSADEFKSRVVALHDFPQEHRREVLRFNIRYLNVKFGVVPERMKLDAFESLSKLGVFKDYVLLSRPLLPFIQSSWDGTQVADWLINAGCVDVSRRLIISENITGRDIYEGRPNDILTYEEIRNAQQYLKEKISKLSKAVWDMSTSSPESRPFIQQTLDLEMDRLASQEEVHRMLTHNYYVELHWIHHPEENDFRVIKNEPQPNIRKDRTSGAQP
jgi:hypothetical protein